MPKVLRIFAVVIMLTGAPPAHAQVPVIDAANLVKAIKIVELTTAVLGKHIEVLDTLNKMSTRLPGSMDRYRTPPIVPSRHEVDRFVYGAPLLAALNDGDARGELYARAVRALPPMAAAVSHLPPAAQRAVTHQYAAIEIADAVAQRGIHQRALVGGFTAGELSAAIQALEADVLHPRTAYHYMTAILDKLAGAEVIDRRQDDAANQLLSHVLEQALLRTKRQRDTQAAVMQMRLTGMQEGPAFQAALIAGAAHDLSSWRQP